MSTSQSLFSNPFCTYNQCQLGNMGVEPRIATAYALYGVTGFCKRVKSGRSKHYAAKRWQIVEPLPQESLRPALDQSRVAVCDCMVPISIREGPCHECDQRVLPTAALCMAPTHGLIRIRTSTMPVPRNRPELHQSWNMRIYRV